jgi:hypothetical protein
MLRLCEAPKRMLAGHHYGLLTEVSGPTELNSLYI